MTDQVRRSVLDQSPVHTPLSILNEEYQPPTPDVEEPSLGSVWDAATYRHWVGSALVRKRKADNVPEEEGYSVSMEQLQQYNADGYSEQELEFLSHSRSPENFAFREQQIKADREAKQVIERAGMKGTAVEIAAAVLDPTMIPLMVAGAPIAAGAKGSQVGRLGWSMLMGASEGALSEYLLKQGDTQRTDEDILLSAIGGMAFSGVLTGGALTVNSLRRANTVEGVQRSAFKDLEAGQAMNVADEHLSTHVPDPVPRKRILTEKEVIFSLREELGDRVDVLSKKKVKALKDEFRTYRKQRTELIEKVKLRPNLRPTARAAEIKQLEDAIARREQVMNEKIELNRQGTLRNAEIDALQQGKIPESLQARYKELKAESGEFDTVTKKGLGSDIVAGHKITPTEETPDPEKMQSVGAMRTRTEFDDINTYDNLLSESDVAEIQSALVSAEDLGARLPRNNRYGEVVKGLRSLYTDLDSAPDNATRGLNAMLLKNPQRTQEGLQSAEELADTLFHRAVPDYLEYQSAFNDFCTDQGIGKFEIGKRNKAEQEFDRQTVMMQVSGNLLSNQPVEGDSALMLGAKARSRLYEQGLKNNQDYDVVGFDKIKHRHEYHSVVFSADNIRQMTGENADFIYDAIASAYQTGGIRLSRENAVRLAESQVARAMSVQGTANKSFDRFMSDAEFKRLSEELESQGVSRDVINDIKDSVFNAEQMGEISPRAMFSLRPNIKARSGDVWMVDLLDTSIARNMKYVSDSAANAGLASNGFHSRHQFQRAVSSARDAAINELRQDVELYKGTKAGTEAEKALADVVDGKYANRIDEAVRLLYKEPLEDGDGLKDMTRILRKATAVTRLRTTGLATLPEAATASVRNGIISTMKQIPATRWFDFRSQSVTTDKFMKDFSRTFSATGHQEYLFGKSFYNGSDFDDATRGALASIDKKLGTALDITMTVNGFKTFQHGGEEMVARSVVNNLKDMAVKGEITGNIRSSLIQVGGMSESSVDRLAKHLKQHKDLDIFHAVRLMDAELHNSLSTAIRNTIGHSYLRMTIGEQPAYMNKEMGKVMTTLMSFTIGSYEKMLLRGIKNERAALLAITAGQAVLGYGALVANTYIQAQNMEGSKRDRYIRERLSDEGMFWGTMARVGVFATPFIPLQMLNTVGALPEEMSGVGRMGGVQAQAIVADVGQAAAGLGRLAFKDQPRAQDERDWNAIKRVLPWYNSTLYNLTIGTATSD